MKDIICITEKYTLDESPDAYKNLNNVIDMQNGIVINYIKPIINVKG